MSFLLDIRPAFIHSPDPNPKHKTNTMQDTAIRFSPAPLPTIHLNGTGAQSLYDEHQRAHEALSEAIKACYACTCHGRDYYPQDDPEALSKAQTARQERMFALEQIAEYHATIMAHCDDALVDASGNSTNTNPN